MIAFLHKDTRFLTGGKGKRQFFLKGGGYLRRKDRCSVIDTPFETIVAGFVTLNRYEQRDEAIGIKGLYLILYFCCRNQKFNH